MDNQVTMESVIITFTVAFMRSSSTTSVVVGHRAIKIK